MKFFFSGAGKEIFEFPDIDVMLTFAYINSNQNPLFSRIVEERSPSPPEKKSTNESVLDVTSNGMQGPGSEDPARSS